MLHLTELEELLASSGGKQYQQKLLAQLYTERQNTKQVLFKGLKPSEYRLQQAKLNALDAALNTLTTQTTQL